MIGFMATGKTAVGRILAKKLKKRYVSTDTAIEEKAGKRIKTIFKLFGEAHFRSLETEALVSLSKKKGLVVSCGGGIVTRPENIRLLRKRGIVVWLKASPATVNKRLKSLGSRPLLDIKDEKARMKKILSMLSKRSGLYRRASHYSVVTDNDTPSRIASRIAGLISSK